jgi:hypothetical protein
MAWLWRRGEVLAGVEFARLPARHGIGLGAHRRLVVGDTLEPRQ